MDQTTLRQWDDIMTDIIERNYLGHAINKLLVIAYQNPQLTTDNEIENISRDYSLMKDFMLQGYQDTSRDDLYCHLLRKTYRAACNLFVRMQIQRGNGIFTQANNWVGKLYLTTDMIRKGMEGFVQDMAFLSLDPNNAETKSIELRKSHTYFMRNVFYWVLIAPQWNNDEADAFTQLLLSPTIDINDARLVVSALTLSLINMFDVNKLRVLVDVYLQSSDEHCKQRALVGIAFSLSHSRERIFPTYRQLVEQLCESEQACKELLELQIQIFYCMDADKDNQQIQKEILPNIMKNNNLTITRFGIQEKEEDPMEDILHPDATDKAMEELEESFQKMKKMQEAGSDIYFGGFSQMKHFPFFNTISNWFMPFYSENPELQEVSIKLKDTKMLTVLLKSGPFCDSDKYSFSLALSTILDKIPANMREMLNSGDAMMMGASDMDTSSPAYIRRMYLQDLYRFFRICRYRSDFNNPFDYTSNTDAFFFANPIFANTRLQESALELCSFLSKRKMYRLLRLVLNTYQPKDNLEFALLEATLSLQENLHDAQDKFKAILNKTPDHEGALRGYAQASFNLGDFRAAEEAYQRLTILFPDNNRYMLNLSISQINNNHVDEGVKILYRLDYEQPNNIYVQRALGWGLMMQKNIEQAIGLYDRLLASEHTIDSDYLNAGYAHWFNRNMAQAVACLGKYVSMRSREAQDDSDSLLAQAFDNDRSLLQLNGISAVESIIMQDIVLNPSKNDD